MLLIYNMNSKKIEELQTPSSFLFLSKRNVGKTVLCEYIINKLLDAKKIDVAYIFSNTAMLGGNWQSIPDKYKKEFVDFKLIQKIIKTQTKTVKQYTEMEKKKKKIQKNKEPRQVAIIFDDVIQNSADKHELLDTLNMLYSKGRHFKISVFLCNQYSKGYVSPTTRANLDYLFVSNNTIEVLNFVYSIVIYDGNKKQFVAFIQNNSQDFYFVMYDNLSRENDKRFYKIIADPDYNEYKIGKNKY